MKEFGSRPRQFDWRVHAVSVAAALLLSGAGRLRSAVQPDASPKGWSICGTVDRGRTPLRGASVTLDGATTVMTDEAGFYRFRNVMLTPQPGAPPGRHFIVVAAAGLDTKIVDISERWLGGQPHSTMNEGACRRVDVSVRSAPVGLVESDDDRAGTFADADDDGLEDALEDWLAERYAPVVYHGRSEPAFPVAVDWWLARTHLAFIDSDSPMAVRRMRQGPLRQEQLLDQRVASVNAGEISSTETRSRGKRISFFLEDVAPEFRRGSATPSDWTTYVHAFPNDLGGITLQYWRAYAWNDARALFVDVSHGGDWEGVAVHLDAALHGASIAFLAHNGIAVERQKVRWEGSHPLVWSQEGGHSSYPDSRPMRSTRFIRQETWTGGRVTGENDERRGRSGGLRNVGEKAHPRSNQVFIQYAGLWGAPHRFFYTSGYWGPAYNETSAQCADGSDAYRFGFRLREDERTCGRIVIRAWCDRMNAAVSSRDAECAAARDIS